MADSGAVRVFISYSHRDAEFFHELLAHLAPLRSAGLIEDLHDRELSPGDPFDYRLTEFLESASIILLLVSADYLDSAPATKEMQRALERAEKQEVRLIPIIVRECAWSSSPLAKFQALPGNTVPVSKWISRDEAWVSVVNGIERAIASRGPQTAKAKARVSVKPEPTNEPVIRRLLTEFTFSPEAARIASRAEGVAPRDGEISAESFLYQAVFHGRSNGKSTYFFMMVAQTLDALHRAFADEIRNLRDDSPLSPAAARLLDLALRAAIATTGNSIISVRHLVFALLQPLEGSRKDELLAAMGIDLSTVTGEYIAFLRNYVPNEMRAWEQLAKRERRASSTASYVPSYAADRPDGTDLLGFERDACALASLVAARATQPPLSIGLFGDWGSGKSFFMGQMQKYVKEIADRAAKVSGAAYHDNIVQITFNAWHYIEGNLWASLVEHIFTSLLSRADAGTDLQKHRDALLDLLKAEDQQKLRAEEAARTARDAADKARAKREEKIEQRVQVAQVKKWASAFTDDDLETLGLTKESVQSIGELRDRARTIWSLFGRLIVVFRLFKEKRGKRLTLLFALALTFAIAAIGGLTYVTLHNSAFVAGAIAFATAVSAYIAPWLARVGTATDAILKKHRELEEERKEQAQAIDRDIQALDRRIAAAEEEATKATKRIAEITADLEKATSSQILSTFIEERAASTDYRRHLGILANVRRDFERMARLLEGRDGKEAGIDRIVLYIDDLDRCPSKHVVKVLEAIHLMLAFPLFVVVVGVDARWIARSLQIEYDMLLTQSSDNDDSLGIEATPHDYLEKIFQVPFWIRPMDRDGFAALIDGLTATAAQERVVETKADAPPPPKLSDPSMPTSESIAAAPIVTNAAATSTPQVDPDLNPVALHVLDDEVKLMKNLLPLLGRSPRTVKRFVNCYRLIKISLDADQVGSFVADPNASLHYRPVMFLLAVVTGTREFGEQFLELLEKTPTEGLTTEALLQIIAATFGETFIAERAIIATMLEAGPIPPAALHAAAPVVRRYSFRAGYGAVRREASSERTRSLTGTPASSHADAIAS